MPPASAVMVRHLSRRLFIWVGVGLLCAGLAPGAAAAPSISLAWDPNTEQDLAGYIVSYGTQPGAYSQSLDVARVTTYTLATLAPGQRYYFAVQAYNNGGLLSSYSNEVTAIVPLGPPPTVTAVSPAIGTVGGNTTVTITGTGFFPGAVVYFGTKAALNTVYVSATSLTAITPAGVAGTVDVRVMNRDEQSGVKAAAFSYQSSIPTITSITPATGLATGNMTLTIRGTNLGTGAVVYVGGIPATSVRQSGTTYMTCVAPAHEAGTVDVRIDFPDGRTVTKTAAFTYVNGKPVIFTVSPAKGSPRGGTLITITGTNFVSGARVLINDVEASSVIIASAKSIIAVTPPDTSTSTSASTASHLVAVKVRNPDAQEVTKASAFTYANVTPTIISLTPTSGPINGGTQVVIKGTEFSPDSVVTVGGAAVRKMVFTDSTKLTVTTPEHAAGLVEVVVTNPDALQAKRRGYTYVGTNEDLDSDGDGMKDAAEERWGLDPNSAEGDDGANGDPDGDGVTNIRELAVGTHPRGFVKRYFAEGVSSSFFTTVFALANPGDVVARVGLRFMRPDGTTHTEHVEIGPRSRASVDANTIAELSGDAFSTTIESDELIVADRTMSWDTDGYGAHSERAIESPALTWYLAEGATHSGFDLFYLLQNPADQDADVEVRYLLPSGDPIVKRYRVAANSRFNIWVDLEDEQLAQTDVSAMITSLNAVPLIVERSMYLNADGRPFGAGHNSAGISAPDTRWFLAEGATGDFFDEFILVANPEEKAAAVTATYMLENGDTVEKHYDVAANSRFNVWVDYEDPALAANPVSAVFESTNGVPIIVERTMWWPGPTAAQWDEAHNSPGAKETALRWAAADGEEDGPQGRATFLLLANTSPYEGRAMVTLLFEDGTTASREYPLPANSRLNVQVGADFAEAAGKRYGALIESLGERAAELVVERALYWDAVGRFWAAGTNSLATPLP